MLRNLQVFHLSPADNSHPFHSSTLNSLEWFFEVFLFLPTRLSPLHTEIFFSCQPCAASALIHSLSRSFITHKELHEHVYAHAHTHTHENNFLEIIIAKEKISFNIFIKAITQKIILYTKIYIFFHSVSRFYWFIHVNI